MSKDKPTPLLAIKMWNFILFWCYNLSSFYTVFFFCTVFILCMCYLTVFEILDITKYFAKCSFFFFIFISRQLLPEKYTAQNFLYQLRFFILDVLLLNWNKTCCNDLFFASFVKLLNIRLHEHSLFLSHLKSVFLNSDREGVKL